MGITVNRIGLDIRFVVEQPIKKVKRLKDSAGNETAEERNVGVRDVIVANASVAAVADMVFSQEVVFIDVPLGAINRGTAARAPELGEVKLVVIIDGYCSGLKQMEDFPLKNEV